MARIRKGVSYRNLERPYTRKSKFRKKNFVRASPGNKVVRFEMGNLKKKEDFDTTLYLKTLDSIQIRDNAIEAARQSANRYLEKNLTKQFYFMKLRVYPHHMLRENPLASGAGADRMSTGMKKSFGKVIGIAAQVKKGQTLFEVRVNKDKIKFAKGALNRAGAKFPCAVQIVEKNNS